MDRSVVQPTGARSEPLPPNFGNNMTVTTLATGDDDKHVMRVEVEPPEPRDPNRPTWLPDKFKEPLDLKTATIELAKKLGRGGAEVKMYEKMTADEDLAAVYSELESTQSKSGQEPPKQEDTPQDDKQPDATQPEPGAVKDLLGKAGLKFDDFQAEFNKSGGLSDESYQKLNNAGFPKGLVDGWITGQQALLDRELGDLYKEAGGSKETFDTMITWAIQNKADVAAYNRAAESGDWKALRSATKGLYAQYEAHGGVEPKLVTGDSRSGGDAVQPFESSMEVVAAMADPRYKRGDAAYHRMVERRLAISNVM
jgi:hypothetical protein